MGNSSIIATVGEDDGSLKKCDFCDLGVAVVRTQIKVPWVLFLLELEGICSHILL